MINNSISISNYQPIIDSFHPITNKSNSKIPHYSIINSNSIYSYPNYLLITYPFSLIAINSFTKSIHYLLLISKSTPNTKLSILSFSKSIPHGAYSPFILYSLTISYLQIRYSQESTTISSHPFFTIYPIKLSISLKSPN